jgi:hypothetical protein
MWISKEDFCIKKKTVDILSIKEDASGFFLILDPPLGGWVPAHSVDPRGPKMA